MFSLFVFIIFLTLTEARIECSNGCNYFLEFEIYIYLLPLLPLSRFIFFFLSFLLFLFPFVLISFYFVLFVFLN